MTMLSSVGAGVGFGVGDFEGAPVVGLLVGLGVGGLEGGPVVGGFVGWNEKVYKVQSTQEMILDMHWYLVQQTRSRAL
jgi:hypothetical protein